MVSKAFDKSKQIQQPTTYHQQKTTKDNLSLFLKIFIINKTLFLFSHM